MLDSKSINHKLGKHSGGIYIWYLYIKILKVSNNKFFFKLSKRFKQAHNQRRHIKSCSISSVIAEMKMKIAMRCHFTPTDVIRRLTTDTSAGTRSHWWRAWPVGVSHGGQEIDGHENRQGGLARRHETRSAISARARKSYRYGPCTRPEVNAQHIWRTIVLQLYSPALPNETRN